MEWQIDMVQSWNFLPKATIIILANTMEVANFKWGRMKILFANSDIKLWFFLTFIARAFGLHSISGSWP
jgi:hypothetical protein